MFLCGAVLPVSFWTVQVNFIFFSKGAAMDTWLSCATAFCVSRGPPLSSHLGCVSRSLLSSYSYLSVCNMHFSWDTWTFCFLSLEETTVLRNWMIIFLSVAFFVFLICEFYWPSWVYDFMVLHTVLEISSYYFFVSFCLWHPTPSPPGNQVSLVL